MIATNGDAWGASSTLMQEIAASTFNFQVRPLVLEVGGTCSNRCQSSHHCLAVHTLPAAIQRNHARNLQAIHREGGSRLAADLQGGSTSPKSCLYTLAEDGYAYLITPLA